MNDSGLSELVNRMIQLYLAPRGLFLMVCPKAHHRHCVERIGEMLRDAPEMDVRVCDVPEWLASGLDEANVVEHQLFVAQWADGRRGADGSDLR